MKKVVLLLDGSAAMNNNTDMTPTRLLALKEPLTNLVKGFLTASPLSVLGLVVMRDGVAHRLTPLTNDYATVLDTMEKSYFLYGGSGHVSLENGLSVAMSELTARKRYDKQAGEILLVSGSLSTVDPGNVLETVQQAQDRKIKCHVLALNGSSHVLQQLSTKSNGTFLCPMTKGQVPHLVNDLGQCVASTRRGAKRNRDDEDGDETVPVLIGLPQRRDGKLVCPQCCAPLPSESTPTTCAICCLLITEESKLRVSALQQAPPRLVPTRFVAESSTTVVDAFTTGGGGGVEVVEHSGDRIELYNCSGCDAILAPSTRGKGNSHRAVTISAIKCASCEELYCKTCATFVCHELFVCPGCF